MAEHKIVVYSTPTCPYCVQAKKYLADKGAAYTDFDVAEDLNARKEMVEKSGQMGVPVLVIDEKIIIGFDRQEIDAALEHVIDASPEQESEASLGQGCDD